MGKEGERWVRVKKEMGRIKVRKEGERRDRGKEGRRKVGQGKEDGTDKGKEEGSREDGHYFNHHFLFPSPEYSNPFARI